MNKAAFLDRDGTINKVLEDDVAIYRVEDFEFEEGVIPALQKLQNLGYMLIVITNQGGIGAGNYTQDDYDAVNNHMLEQLEREGISITQVYHCPHLVGSEMSQYNIDCMCRKPRPGMLENAIVKFGIDAKASFMVGDKLTDVQAGRSVGAKTAAIGNYEKGSADYVGSSLLDVVENFVSRI